MNDKELKETFDAAVKLSYNIRKEVGWEARSEDILKFSKLHSIIKGHVFSKEADLIQYYANQISKDTLLRFPTKI